MTSRLAIVVGLFSGIVFNASAEARVLEHIVSHDNTSVVSFSTFTALDCGGGGLSTNVTLNGFEFTNRSTTNGDVRSNTAVIAISQFNSCTGEFVFGIANADGGFNQDVLKSATFSANVQLMSFDIPPVAVGTAVVNVTITGGGPVTSNNQHFRFTVFSPTGPVVETIHTNGKTVDSNVVSGTISFRGVPIPLPPQDQIFSEIAVTKSGTMELVKSN
jgi:hypothetical protein